MIKMIATDMDGTFLDSNKRFNPEFIEMFYQMKEKGIKFVVASGNQYYRLYQKFIPLSEQIYFIAENGSFIADGATELYCNTIENEDVEKTKEILTAYPELVVVLCGRKGAYILNQDRQYKDEIRKYYCNYRFVENFDDVKDGIMKVAIYDPSDNLDEKLKNVQSQLPERVKIVTSGNTWMDVQNKDINKGIALRFLQAVYEIEPDECVAFGDQMNDYELLKQVKYGYAMSNAVQPIKDIAYEMIGSNDEQGVIIKIKEILDQA